MEIFQNTYRKLDRDTAINKYDNQSYYDARNVRITSDDPLKSGAISNVLGNELLISAFPSYSSDKIIGAKKFRDQVVIFSSPQDDDEGALDGKLWVWTNNNIAFNVGNLELLYNGFNFSQQFPIEHIEVFYEGPDVQKVYWTDGYNNLHYANIADADILTKDLAEFDIIPDIDLSSPTLNAITTGSIPVGMVQYAYRLYRLNGSASNFCPAGNLIPITTASESMGNTIQYRGSDYLDSNGNPVISGKGVRIKIEDIDDTYDRIEVVAIHYDRIHSTPRIYIVEVSPTTSTMYFTDEGLWDIGEYSLSEFLLISNPFVAKTIASKNNILFAGNIEGDEYDLSFDARAYRYSTEDAGLKHCYLYEHDSGSFSIGADVLGTYYVRELTAGDVWIKYINNVAQTPTYTTATLPEDIDAICMNNPKYDQNQNQPLAGKYQQSTYDVGGEGVNVAYTFGVKDQMVIDLQANADEIITFKQGSTDAPYYYYGPDSPYYNQEYTTWVRDETYRFGVVFFDEKGRLSPVKWIGDIRMPHQMETLGEVEPGFSYTSDLGGDQLINYGQPIKVTFELTNIPTTAKYCQIVYVERTNVDKTCVAQGVLGWQYSGFESFLFMDPLFNITKANYSSQTFLNMFSPEFSVFKDFSKGSDDYLEIIGNVTVTDQANHDYDASFPVINYITKHHSFTPVASVWKAVADARLEIANTTLDIEHTTKNFAGNDYEQGMSQDATHEADLGTCLLIDVADALILTTLSADTGIMVNYRKMLFGSQYGGYSFEDRSRNVYIPAGPMVKITAQAATAYASWGDAWIGYSDHLTAFFNDYYYTDNSVGYMTVDYIPCETSVNLTYRHDDSFHTVYESDAAIYMKETGNAEFSVIETGVGTDTNTYSPDWTDYYVYNTVYSRRPDARKYYAKPLDYITSFANDIIVQASDVKEGMETIDPWTRWANNEYLYVDGTHGPLNRLYSWKNELLYWQEDAVGVLSVFDRSVLSDSQGKQVSLGEGTILQRYDHIITEAGISTKQSIASSSSGIYWFDAKRKKFRRFRNSIEDIGIVYGINSWLKDIADDVISADCAISSDLDYKGFVMADNPLYNEIWFTVKSALATGTTLVYNEIVDSFTGFLDNHACMQFTINDRLFSSYSSALYEENIGDKGHFMGSYYDSYITMMVVPMANIPVTVSNFEITSEVWDGASHMHDLTMTNIQVENDYQDTGVVTIDSDNSRRLLRTWKIDAGRNSGDDARLRDTYSKVTLTYENDASNYGIVLHDFLTLYSVPAESIANKMREN